MSHKHDTLDEFAKCIRCGETIFAVDGKPPIPAYLDRIADLKTKCAELSKMNSDGMDMLAKEIAKCAELENRNQHLEQRQKLIRDKGLGRAILEQADKIEWQTELLSEASIIIHKAIVTSASDGCLEWLETYEKGAP